MSLLRSKHLQSASALALFCALAAGSVDTDQGAQNVREQPASFTLSANQLYEAYDSNKVAADAKYKDKVVVVSGEIKDIGKDITDTAYLVIGGSGFLDGVQCMFPEGQEPEIGGLGKGAFISAKGKVSGQVMGNVLIRNCTLE